MLIRRLLPAFVLVVTLGCETPASPTTVITTVTLPTSPSVVTSPVTTTPTTPCTTTPTCTGSGTTPSPTAPRAPEILSFGADSGARILKGASAVLRWEVSDPAAQVRIDPGIGSVGTVGFVLVFPTATTTYTLTARNSVATVQRQFTVIVLASDS